jgi:hypothetical protein
MSELIERICKRIEQRNLDRQFVMAKREVGINSGDILWTTLAERINEEIEQLGKLAPTFRYTVEGSKSSKITIHAGTIPRTTLILERIPSGVKSKIESISHGLATTKTIEECAWFFWADDQLKPCLTDYETEYAMDTLIEMILNAFIGEWMRLEGL